MIKDVFKGKYRVFYGNGLYMSIMFGVGIVVLDLMILGFFLLLFF